jgi:hypothetical protein
VIKGKVADTSAIDKMAAHIASLLSVICLFSVNILVFSVLCIARIPKASAAGYYLIAVEGVIGLAQFVALVGLAEAVFDKVCTLMAYCFSKRSSSVEDVMISYYTKARDDIDAEARGRETWIKSRLETDAKILEALQVMIDDRVKVKSLFDAALDKYARKSESEDEITSVGVEDKASVEKNDIKSSVSSEGSSTRSAAHTD